MSGFYKYFKENMEALGLAAPESLFGTLQTAIGTAATILSQIDKYGPRNRQYRCCNRSIRCWRHYNR